MKTRNVRNSLFALALAAGALCLPALAQAQTYTYHVDFTIAAGTLASVNGPYYLDFQLNGDGLPATATNSISASGFTFTGGTPTGTTATTFEGASGSLNTSVMLTLNNTNTFNELYQGFSNTTTDIQFNVTTTMNGSGITPDTFLVQILNGSMNPLTTNAPDGASLVNQSINGPVTQASVLTYRSTSPVGVVAISVPEPTIGAAVLAGTGALALVFRKRKTA